MVLGWNLFVAAMTSNQDLRTNLISRVHNRASFNLSAGVFPFRYDSTHGSTILGGARWALENISVYEVLTKIVALLVSPAQGAMYAPLALTFVGSSCLFIRGLTLYIVEFLSSK